MMVMLMLGMLALQADRPSALPAFDRPPVGAAMRGGAEAECTLKSVEVGKPIPKKLLRERPNPVRLRILRPGDRATMDFLPSRRNIHVDGEGKVVRITCG